MQQRPLLLAAVCLVGAACDIPTEPPIVEQRWILPFDEVTLDQSELLPLAVNIVGDAYSVNVDDVTAAETLGNLCPACAPFDGLLVPVPAFQGSFTSTDSLPTDVIEVVVQGGTVDVSMTNGLTFDPLAGGGTLTITVAGASGGPVLGSLTVDGAVDTFASGSTTVETLVLAGGTITGAIETTVEIDSPGGENAVVHTSDQVLLSAVTTSLLVSSVTADVAGRGAQLSEQDLQAEDLGDGVVESIMSGAVVLDVDNPFGVSLTGTLSIGSVTKPLLIPVDPRSTVRIEYTGDELREFLGVADATFVGAGTLGGGPATVTPTDELVIDPTIDLILELGG